MLTDDEVQILQSIRDGNTPERNQHTASLIERGYVTDSDGALAVTEHGEGKMRILPSLGEAMADILIPGAGTAEANAAQARDERETNKVKP